MNSIQHCHEYCKVLMIFYTPLLCIRLCNLDISDDVLANITLPLSSRSLPRNIVKNVIVEQCSF